MPQAHIQDGLTFDDVLLVPGHSTVHPNQVDLSTLLTPGIRLAMPLVSSPMDTVTEHRTAIGMAQAGGIGFIHKNLSIQGQVAEVATTLPTALPGDKPPWRAGVLTLEWVLK